jgi:hypothetical protein
MKQEDIIRMAQECGLIGMRPHLDGIYQEALAAFAALVRADEREECACLCDALERTKVYGAKECAEGIRVRSKHEQDT